MEKIRVKIRKIKPNAKIPKAATMYISGGDLYAEIDKKIIIPPHDNALIETGIAAEIPKGFVGLLFAPAEIASARSLAPVNRVGIINAGYQEEIIITMHNYSDEYQTISAGERIAHLLITPYHMDAFEI